MKFKIIFFSLSALVLQGSQNVWQNVESLIEQFEMTDAYLKACGYRLQAPLAKIVALDNSINEHEDLFQSSCLKLKYLKNTGMLSSVVGFYCGYKKFVEKDSKYTWGSVLFGSAACATLSVYLYEKILISQKKKYIKYKFSIEEIRFLHAMQQTLLIGQLKGDTFFSTVYKEKLSESKH